MNLKDFAMIALDVEQDKTKVKLCECCNRYPSSYLYLIKSNIYGIFHICDLCKAAVEELPKTMATAFVPKDFSTYQ